MSNAPGTIQRTYRMRVYPTSAQQATLARWFGAARWAWNHSLERRTKAYRRRGESVSGVDVSRALSGLKGTNRYSWLAEIPATVITQKLRDQDRSFVNFFAGRACHPQFKKRGHNESVRLQVDRRQARRCARWAGGEIDVPGLGVLRYRGNWHPRQAPKMVTVRRDAAGRYFVTAMVEEPAPAAPKASGIVGIDLGLKDLAVLSTGEKIPNPRLLRRARHLLKRAQRRLARARKGSKRRQELRRRVAKLHAHVRDTRNDYLHKLTRWLVDENQVIAVEDLCIRGLARSKLAASVHDVAWGELLRQLDYKAAWAGRTVMSIGRFEPSTRRCSACGELAEKFGLNVRAWQCAGCEAELDRDINAAVNIRNLGLAQLVPGGTGELMRVEDGRPLGAAGQRRLIAQASVEARTGRTLARGREPGARV